MYIAIDKLTNEKNEFSWTFDDNLIIKENLVNPNNYEIVEVVDGVIITADSY